MVKIPIVTSLHENVDRASASPGHVAMRLRKLPLLAHLVESADGSVSALSIRQP